MTKNEDLKACGTTEKLLQGLLALSNKTSATFLIENGCTPSVNYDNNVRRVCAFLENIILNTRPTVTPTDNSALDATVKLEAIGGGKSKYAQGRRDLANLILPLLKATSTPTNSAMEDNMGRSGSNGMASVEGSTPSLPNPSATDGGAERALADLTSANQGQIMTAVLTHWTTIIEALQSTRKPPVDTISPEFNCEMDTAITYLQDDLRKNGHDLVWKDRYIATLIKGYQTERTMHYAWEKRAYEAENKVDTIAVPREVLQGMREALQGCLKELWDDNKATTTQAAFDDYFKDEKKALASLDAVLSEGE